MHPKLSRAARRLLCCAGAAAGEDLSDDGSGSLRWVFSLRELRSATNSFNYDNKIGEGPLGSVYWGQVWDGSQIAVKRLKNAKYGTEAEFASEVEILGRIRHKNLLSLRGYCADGPERILVYDYMTNSSLYAHLHGTHSAECLLDWRRRASIAIGTARALLYLHHHATPQTIHGSIKATNVLLDSDYQAHVDSKLSDKYSESELKRMVLIGLACTHSESEKRPTMLEVVPLLKGELKEMLSKLEKDELFRPDLTVSSHGTSTPEGSTDSVPKKDDESVGA
ncbi:hypothetical protein PR202_ga18058 [Eleusine coracana subsp. coracana]|uniref:non-specific serine/threonine protein kinase n=1 Tax=Eleusine coracana subsp. coracana TaxID=191504 RepID=A0AAV5CQG6_ELECO|nr:hypothetical protein PR202_ga18058 [Eleusine coracana subsp. coracana]